MGLDMNLREQTNMCLIFEQKFFHPDTVSIDPFFLLRLTDTQLKSPHSSCNQSPLASQIHMGPVC